MAEPITDVCDVCIVGVGGLGGILAKELASAGLKVVGFERGPASRCQIVGKKN
jgi:choline dehydrogenase-like flavoprotein